MESGDNVDCGWHPWAEDYFNICYNILSYLADMTHEYGNKEISDKIVNKFNELVS